MFVWLLVLGCATDPHVLREPTRHEPVLPPVHDLLDGTTWSCEWIVFVRGEELVVPHTWSFHRDGTLTTDLAERLAADAWRRGLRPGDGRAMLDFLDFRSYGPPEPRTDLDFREVTWLGVGADTLLVPFDTDASAPAEKWTIVPSGVDAMHLDRDGEEPWVITCRLAPG